MSKSQIPAKAETQNQPNCQDVELFDLTAVVKAWAINAFMDAADKKMKKVCRSSGGGTGALEVHLIWDEVVCWSESPRFEDSHSVQLPKCHALFSTSYKNSTDGVQEYNFRTERSTRSTAEIEISKGFTATKELGVKLQASLKKLFHILLIRNTQINAYSSNQAEIFLKITCSQHYLLMFCLHFPSFLSDY